MGAWGAGCFENDDALDWLCDLEDSDSSDLIRETIQVAIDAPPGDDLEAPECCSALAACEMVAALSGKPPSDLPEDAKAWLEQNSAVADNAVLQLAMKAVERIRTDSELKDLWEDAESLDEWTPVVDDLASRLRVVCN